jgi:hypothetical protein
VQRFTDQKQEWNALYSSMQTGKSYQFELDAKAVDFYDHKQRYLLNSGHVNQQYLGDCFRIRVSEETTYDLLNDLIYDV